MWWKNKSFFKIDGDAKFIDFGREKNSIGFLKSGGRERKIQKIEKKKNDVLDALQISNVRRHSRYFQFFFNFCVCDSELTHVLDKQGVLARCGCVQKFQVDETRYR